MQTISISFIVPQGWHELSDKQLRYVYQLIADNFTTDEIKTLCLLRWSGTKVVQMSAEDESLLSDYAECSRLKAKPKVIGSQDSGFYNLFILEVYGRYRHSPIFAFGEWLFD